MYLVANIRQQRLLNKQEAAAYLGMSAASFDRLCDVRPITIGGDRLAWDVADLDDWIERLKGGKLDSGEDWLQKVR